MRSALSAPFFVAACLLAWGGIAKVLRPAGAARALSVVGIGVGRPTVRAAGAGEAALGALALIVPTRPVALAVVASYVVFAVLVARMARTGGAVSSCGCFGDRPVRPSRLHVWVNVAAALAAALVAAAGGAPSVVEAALRLPLLGLPLLLGLATSAWLVTLAVAHLPELFFAWEGAAARARRGATAVGVTARGGRA